MDSLKSVLSHPEAKSKCPICKGGGWLDDSGPGQLPNLVPCFCTGCCPPDVVDKLNRNFPDKMAELRQGLPEVIELTYKSAIKLKRKNCIDCGDPLSNDSPYDNHCVFCG